MTYARLIVDVMLEEMYGTRGRLILTKYRILDNPEVITYDAVMSKNTKPGEKPYRLTWFDRKMQPLHVSMDRTDADTLLKGYMPDSVWMELTNRLRISDVMFEVVRT